MRKDLLNPEGLDVSNVDEELGEFLSPDQMARLLGVGRTLFDELVQAGKIPPPLTLGPRTNRWHRRTIEEYAHRIHLGA